MNPKRNSLHKLTRGRLGGAGGPTARPPGAGVKGLELEGKGRRASDLELEGRGGHRLALCPVACAAPAEHEQPNSGSGIGQMGGTAVG